MTHVVFENCVLCKYTDCVEVCPVDCFYEGETMLAIHPDERIDCGVCVPECRAEAIIPDSENSIPRGLKSIVNTLPFITQKKPPLADADAMNGTSGQYEAFFSSEPGTGD